MLLVFDLLPAPLGNAKIWAPPSKTGLFRGMSGKTTAKDAGGIVMGSSFKPILA